MRLVRNLIYGFHPLFDFTSVIECALALRRAHVLGFFFYVFNDVVERIVNILGDGVHTPFAYFLTLGLDASSQKIDSMVSPCQVPHVTSKKEALCAPLEFHHIRRWETVERGREFHVGANTYVAREHALTVS